MTNYTIHLAPEVAEDPMVTSCKRTKSSAFA